MIEDIAGEQIPLAEVDVIRELPQSEVEYLARRCPIVHLAEKEGLTLGEYQRGVFLLLSGRVRVHEPSTFGVQDLTFSVLEGGTVVGQPAFKPRPSLALRVEALEASVLMVVRREDFEGVVLRNPRVGLKTLGLFSERLDEYEGRLSDTVRKEVPARLAGLLLRLSEREEVMAGDGERRIPARYTHRLLASMVGSNREAVTRAFGVLRQAGAVETRNRRIYVTDEVTLAGLAEAER
jgi:CRP/FNR family transcriptional regulator, cyclic AMP receptor protein